MRGQRADQAAQRDLGEAVQRDQDAASWWRGEKHDHRGHRRDPETRADRGDQRHGRDGESQDQDLRDDRMLAHHDPQHPGGSAGDRAKQAVEAGAERGAQGALHNDDGAEDRPVSFRQTENPGYREAGHGGRGHAQRGPDGVQWQPGNAARGHGRRCRSAQVGSPRVISPCHSLRSCKRAWRRRAAGHPCTERPAFPVRPLAPRAGRNGPPSADRSSRAAGGRPSSAAGRTGRRAGTPPRRRLKPRPAACAFDQIAMA